MVRVFIAILVGFTGSVLLSAPAQALFSSPRTFNCVMQTVCGQTRAHSQSTLSAQDFATLLDNYDMTLVGEPANNLRKWSSFFNELVNRFERDRRNEQPGQLRYDGFYDYLVFEDQSLLRSEVGSQHRARLYVPDDFVTPECPVTAEYICTRTR